MSLTSTRPPGSWRTAATTPSAGFGRRVGRVDQTDGRSLRGERRAGSATASGNKSLRMIERVEVDV